MRREPSWEHTTVPRRACRGVGQAQDLVQGSWKGQRDPLGCKVECPGATGLVGF